MNLQIRLRRGALLLALLFSLSAFAGNVRAQGSINGEVTLENGRSVSSATVQLVRKGSKSAPLKVQADKSGKFSFPNLTEGVYEVDATGTGGLMAPSQVVRVQRSDTKISLRMRPGTTAAAKPGTAAVAPVKKKRRIWVPPPAGSIIGGGYVDVDEDAQETADSKRTRAEVRHQQDVQYRVYHQGASGP
ncbi:MAG: carboxypeptidase-like regulatory domain-containing protein [Verrucomicrobiota bacterium]